MFREQVRNDNSVRENRRGFAGVSPRLAAVALVLALLVGPATVSSAADFLERHPIRIQAADPDDPMGAAKLLEKNRDRFTDFQGAETRAASKADAVLPIRPSPIHGTLSTLVLLGGPGNVHSREEIQQHVFSVGQYFNAPTASASGTRNGSFRDYVLESSYGLLDIEGQVRGWYPNAGGSGEGFITSLVSQADPFVNFALFDNDGPDGIPNSGDDDGIVDFLITYSSVALGGGVGLGSSGLYLELATPFQTADGVSINAAYIVPEDLEVFGANELAGLVTPVGWLPPGMGFNFGLPDMTDNDGSSVGTGIWSVMDYGFALAPPGYVMGSGPGHFSAWSKWQLGWLYPRTIQGAQSGVSVQASASMPDAVRVFRKNQPDGDEYFLAEYKSNSAGTIFDRGYPLAEFGRGFLLWHIDDALLSNPALNSNNINSDESHPLIKVVQADGLGQLQRAPDFTVATTYGDDGDTWPGSTGKGTFDNESNPNSKDHAGNPTGLRITNFSLTSGSSGSFSVEFDTYPPTLQIVSPGALPLPPVRDDLEIRWRDSDPDSNAKIGFYFTEDPNIALNAAGLTELRRTRIDLQGRRIQGIIRENIAEDETTNRIIWNTLDPEVASGFYYIYGSITDGETLLVVRSIRAVEINHSNPPLITILEPDGVNDVVHTSFTIRWQDSGDADATVRIFYDNDNVGRDGTEITTQPIPASNPNKTLVWNTLDIWPGQYYIYAEITKAGFPTVAAYSSAPVIVNHPPSIEIIAPSDQGEIAAGSYSICWNDNDDAFDATVSLYYNTVNDIAGASLIVDGISEDDFTDCYLWDTTGIEPGCYYIIGRIDDGFFPRVSVSNGTVCVVDEPVEVRIAARNLTRPGQRIEALSEPIALVGFDMNVGNRTAYLESIELEFIDTSRGSGSFDINTDLKRVFNDIGSGIGLYQDAPGGGAGAGKSDVVYGQDDRLEVFEAEARWQQAFRSTCVLVQRDNLVDNGDGTYSLQGVTYQQAQGLCDGVRFAAQPVPGFCSGFVVGTNLVASAGHCIETQEDLVDTAFVFGFRMQDANNAVTRIPAADIYFGEAIIGRELDPQTESDWGIFRVGRAISGRPALPVRRAGKIANGQAITVIGHPSGMPAKVSPGANVTENDNPVYFAGNLDASAGNSGSAVFNSSTLTVEGILVRGPAMGYVPQGSCNVEATLPDDGLPQVDNTRSTVFADFIDAAGGPSINAFFDSNDTLIPIQPIQFVGNNRIRIVPRNPLVLPSSEQGDFAGDDLFFVIRTSENIQFLDGVQIRVPEGGIRISSDNVGRGNEVYTDPIEANPPTFITDEVSLRGRPTAPIGLERPGEPVAVFGISMSDNYQEVYLNSIRVNIVDGGGFSPATDLIAMATHGGGLGLFRDSDGDGLFDPAIDQEITLASVPMFSGSAVRTANLVLPPNAFPVPDTEIFVGLERKPVSDLFVVIRPSQYVLQTDSFQVAIPSGGIVYDYRGGVPAVITSGANARSVQYFGINPNLSIEVIEPDGINDMADERYTIRWVSSRTPGAGIRLFYDSNNSGRDGVELTASPIPADGSQSTFVWDTRNVFPGNYWIYAELELPGFEPVFDYSNGPVTINHPPTLRILTPATIGEEAVGSFNICWEDFNQGGSAVISLYYNTTPDIVGAVPINGAQAISAESEINCFVWNTCDVAPGCYYIIGVIDDGQFLRNSVSPGTVCVRECGDEPRLTIHDLTRPGQRIEADSPPFAIFGIDANRGSSTARLERIRLRFNNVSGFDMLDLEPLFRNSTESGIALYRDSTAYSSDTQLIFSASAFAELPVQAPPFGTGDITYSTVQINLPPIGAGNVVYLSGSSTQPTPFGALTTVRLGANDFNVVPVGGSMILVNEGASYRSIAPLHDPVDITDLVGGGGGPITLSLVLKQGSPYRSSSTSARVVANTAISVLVLEQLPDLTTNGFFNVGDEIIPIQDVNVINGNTVDLIPTNPPLLPSSDTGQDLGDDYFIVLRTSKDIEYLDTFSVTIPANGILTSEALLGSAVTTHDMTTNPPTFLDVAAFPEGKPSSPILLTEPLEPWPVFRISMSDNGGDVFLKSIRVNFINFLGFTPSTDLLPMATSGGGISLYLDSDGDGFFTDGVDQELTLAEVPVIGGGLERSVNLVLPDDAFPLPDVSDRAPDIFVVIRPSTFILSGDEFKMRIPAGGILFTDRGVMPPVTVTSQVFLLSDLYRAETNQVQVELVNLTEFGQRLERESGLVPVVGIRIWDPSSLGPVFNTLESITLEIVNEGGFDNADLLPISGNSSGGVALLDARLALGGALSIAAASGTGQVSVIESDRKVQVYQSSRVTLRKSVKTRVYLSGTPGELTPFTVAGDIRINGNVARQFRGYGSQIAWPNTIDPGEFYDIDELYTPHEPMDVTHFFRPGVQEVTIDLVARDDLAVEPDSLHLVAGNTSLYLVQIGQFDTLGVPEPDIDGPVSIDANKTWNGSAFTIVPLENTALFPTPYTDKGVDFYIALRTSATISYLDSFRVRIPEGGVLTSRGRAGRELVTEKLTCNPPTFISGLAQEASQPIIAANFPIGVYGIGMSDSGLENQELISVEVHLHDLFGFSRPDLVSMESIPSGVSLYRDRDGDGLFNPFTDERIPLKPADFLGIDPIRIILEPVTPVPVPDVNDSVADVFVVITPSETLELDNMFSVEIPQRGIRYRNLRSGKSAFSAAFISEVNQKPFVRLLNPKAGGEVAGNNFRLLWEDRDPDNDARISLYFSANPNIDTSNEVALLTTPGVFPVRNGLNISENDGTDAFMWDTSERELNIIPGTRYWVYALIRDDESAMVSRSPGFVRVSREGLLSYLKLTTFGTVHSPGGFKIYGNAPLLFDPIARDLEVTANQDGYTIMDQRGRLYWFGNAPILPGLNLPADSPVKAVDFEYSPDQMGAFFLLDNGEVRTVGTAQALGHPDLSAGAAVDLAVNRFGDGYIILDRDGMTYSFGNMREFDTALMVGGEARDLELTPTGEGLYVLDVRGNTHAYGDARTDLRTDNIGIPLSRSLKAVPDKTGATVGLIAMDGFGTTHAAGDVNTMVDEDFADMDTFTDLELVNIAEVPQAAVIEALERFYRAVTFEDSGAIKNLLSSNYSDHHGNDFKAAQDFFKQNFDVYEWRSRRIIGDADDADISSTPLTARASLPTQDMVFIPSMVTADLNREPVSTQIEITVPFTQKIHVRKRLDGRGYRIYVYDVDISFEFDPVFSRSYDDVIYRKFFDDDGDEFGSFTARYEGDRENNLYVVMAEAWFADSTNRFDSGILEVFPYLGEQLMASSVVVSTTGSGTGTIGANYEWEMVNEDGQYRITKGTLYQLLPELGEEVGTVGFRLDRRGPNFNTLAGDADVQYIGGDLGVSNFRGGIANMTTLIGAQTLDDVGQVDVDRLLEFDWQESVPAVAGSVYAVRLRDGKKWGKVQVVQILGDPSSGVLLDWEYRNEFVLKNPAPQKPGAQ